MRSLSQVIAIRTAHVLEGIKMIISSNLSLHKKLPLSAWRKIAIGTWKTSKDPSSYGMVEISVSKAMLFLEEQNKTSHHKITITHFVGKALAIVMEKVPEINSVLRFSQLYPRKNIDVFFQVASDLEGKDLTGSIVRDVNKLKIEEIAHKLGHDAKRIKEGNDLNFKKMKNLFKFIPSFCVSYLINAVSFIQYQLNIWSPLIGTPKNSFGSIMVTNIGSIGLDYAFAPLVAYSKVPIIACLGKIKKTPVVRDNEIVIDDILKIGFTIDHRHIDGVHAAKMAKILSDLFENPEKIL